MKHKKEKMLVVTSALGVLLILASIVLATKWSDYADQTAGNVNDVDTFLIRDVSDTTLAATGTQKEYPWSVLKADLVTAGFHKADSTGNFLFGDPGGPFLTDDNYVELDGTADAMDDDEFNGVVIGGRNCGEGLTEWDTVRLVNDADPWHQADANAAGEFPAHGLTIGACTDTNEAIILVRGIVRNEGWSGLTPAGAVYLSETAGGITQTAPSDSGDAIQIVGWALSDSEIYFDFSRPYLEVE